MQKTAFTFMGIFCPSYETSTGKKFPPQISSFLIFSGNKNQLTFSIKKLIKIYPVSKMCMVNYALNCAECRGNPLSHWLQSWSFIIFKNFTPQFWISLRSDERFYSCGISVNKTWALTPLVSGYPFYQWEGAGFDPRWAHIFCWVLILEGSAYTNLLTIEV